MQCIVCNGHSFQKIYDGTLLKCTTCGFVTADISIDNNILSEIYSEKYFKGEEYLDYVKDKDCIQKNFANKLAYIFKKVDRHDIKSVLEIGCAYGFFAETIKQLIPDINYTGVDIVEEAIEYGKKELNQNLRCADYLQVEPQTKYTDVFMWDVIEHLEHPNKFIDKIHNELENNGRLYITTGNINACVARMRKHKWRLIHPPTHLHYFSDTTIRKFLERKGFEVINVSYHPLHRSLKQMYYSLFMLNKKPAAITNYIYKLIPPKLSIPINLFDIMFVIAQKK